MGSNKIYLASVSSPSLTPDEIRAAAEVHHELGPDYQSAVIESFLDKVGTEIDARVEARLAGRQAGPAPYPGQPASFAPAMQPPARSSRDAKPIALAIISIVLGIPLTAIAVAASGAPSHGVAEPIVLWIAIAVINVAYSFSGRPPANRR